jgi:hypothetical protein
MSGERKEQVDANTEVMLYKFKDDIIDVIKEQNKELKEALTAQSDLKFKNVEDKQVTFSKYHDEHFKETKQIDTKISGAVETLRKEIVKSSRFRWQYLLIVIPIVISVISFLI